MDALDLNDIDSHTLGINRVQIKDQDASILPVVQENIPKTEFSISTVANVRSSAVVTYSASKFPALFSHLAPQTNLNLAPSNWLRSAPGLRPDSLLSGNRTKPSTANMQNVTQFSSFSMADCHIRIMDQIDVVSDAENIKKLMKVAYSKSRVSMAVHRVGKTLLLEKFDPGRISVSSSNADESNDNLLDKVYNYLLPENQRSRKKLPSAQHDRVMLSKFLYYSLNEGTATSDDSEQKQIDIQPSLSENDPQELNTFSGSDTNVKVEKNLSGSLLVPTEQRWRLWTPADSTSQHNYVKTDSTSQHNYDILDSFERTILWKFDDLQMLLGTNMPIFGRGEYPAVSLRLRDSNKPINILTGIDYWLDNLICNVPEVVMCFHVNGIVQNYEVIKTEEIPKLENSKFDPQLIRDIAQNVLSFVKSNCTQEGHTYWLFKGSNDDVVKLYDLTMICDQKERSGRYKDCHNPFTISVASLLYKMSINLMQQTENLPNKNETITRLLTNCVSLLERKITLAPVMLVGALCILSTLSLPNTRTPDERTKSSDADKTSPRRRSSPVTSEETESDTHEEDDKPSADLLRLVEKKFISVSELSVHRKSTGSPDFEKNLTKGGTSENTCAATLSWITKGLHVFRFCTEADVMWSDECLDDMMVIHTQLIRNTTLVYYHMASQAFDKEEYGASLRCVDRALQSHEYLEQLESSKAKDQSSSSAIADILQSNSPPDFSLLLSRLLALCGSCHLAIMQSNNLPLYEEQYQALHSQDVAIKEALLRNFVSADNKHRWMTSPVDGVAKSLTTSRSCYESALEHLRSVTSHVKKNDATDVRNSSQNRTKSSSASAPGWGQSQDKSGLLVSITRKVGHVANEQGALEMNEAVEVLGRQDKGQSLEKGLEAQKLIWKSCFAHFDFASKSFASVSDVINQALVLSNQGRLMRICAQAIALSENDEFTMHEQNLYDSAIEYYQKALTLQQNMKDHRQSGSGNRDNSRQSPSSVYDNVSWELSTTYFTMARRLQDHSPLRSRSPDEVERQISNLMSKSLRSCCDIWKNTEKRSMVDYRCGQIHARLASLHHNSFRNASQTTKRRHYRSLAESQYSKAYSFLEPLVDEHPAELLRVQLERLALKEQHISTVNHLNEKLKIAVDAVISLSGCSSPLEIMKTFLKRKELDDDATTSNPVDPQSYADTSQRDDVKKVSASYDVEEWVRLVEIISKITLSLLLLLLKSTLPSSGAETSTRKRSHSANSNTTSHNLYKDLYSRALRSLQESTSTSEGKNVTDAERRSLLLKRVISVLTVLRDIAAVKLK